MTLILPNLKSALVNAKGFVLQPWITFFQQFTQAPSQVIDLNVASSPFSYTAVEPGFLVISNGTVSAVTLTRGSTTVTGVGTLVPVAIGDVVAITYSAAPTVQFFPSF